ncbi:MAG: two-component system, NarL family, sensor histidine kinase UhpB, partial [Actinomycetota bacterium]|nr:two-component system, NarL family, sensor histidine kinase UhpB [Actinomycetota bacterium]
RGLAPQAAGSAHYGLRWLTERVEALGGTLRLEPALPRGVRLLVQVPLHAAAAVEQAA